MTGYAPGSFLPGSSTASVLRDANCSGSYWHSLPFSKRGSNAVATYSYGFSAEFQAERGRRETPHPQPPPNHPAVTAVIGTRTAGRSVATPFESG